MPTLLEIYASQSFSANQYKLNLSEERGLTSLDIVQALPTSLGRRPLIMSTEVWALSDDRRETVTICLGKLAVLNGVEV